jgi:hypothetical protein
MKAMQMRCWRGALSALAAFCVLGSTFTLSTPAAYAQGRGPGDRTGGGGPRRGDDAGPRKTDDPAPRRDVAPPPQREQAPPRVDPPPQREQAPPRVDPPRREEAPPRVDPPKVDPPRREEAPPRVDPAPRRDVAPPREQVQPRRDDPAPRREVTPPAREAAPPAHGPAPRRDTAGPRLSPGATDPAPRRTQRDGPGDRTGGGSAVDRAPRSPEVRPRTGAGSPGAVGGGSRPTGSADTSARPKPSDPAPVRNRALDIFTRSAEGRRYANGVYLRNGVQISSPVIRRYFPQPYCSYPYYYPTYVPAVAFYSPYSSYYGVCPPYITQRHTYQAPPVVVYIDVPVYRDDQWRGYEDDLDEYYLDRRYARNDTWYVDGELRRAVEGIETAFRDQSIGELVDVTDPSVHIAVFRQGKYEYSLSASDYLDMTRDMMRSTDTVEFRLDRVRRRTDGVYVASGVHTYRDPDRRNRTVYVCFALERILGHWVITQVGTAPDRIEDI